VTSPARTQRPRDAALAIGLILASCMLVAGTTLIAKMLGPAGSAHPLHPLQVTAGRFGFAALALLPFLAWRRPSLAGTAWREHGLRVISGWAGVSCLFAAAAAMRLADATAIGFLSPIVTMVLSVPLLGERVGPWRWTAAAVSFAGAVVLTGPGTAAFQPMALVALCAALFLGLEAILIKRLSHRESTLRIIAISNIAGAVIALAATVPVWTEPLPQQWLMLALLGLIMLAVQVLFIQAVRLGDASFVMPFVYTTLLFAGLYDFVIFGVLPASTGWIGAALIVAGAITIAWRERVQRKAD